MFFKRLPTITSDKITLPKYQALTKAWGELTNIAILMVSDMLKKPQLTSINALYAQMANMRYFITRT